MIEYISREAANKALCEFCGICTEACDLKECEIVSNYSFPHIPAADVRPVVRGRWRLYSPLTDTYECDKCGYQVIDESFRTNFCPNCGADCRGDNSGE